MNVTPARSNVLDPVDSWGGLSLLWLLAFGETIIIYELIALQVEQDFFSELNSWVIPSTTSRWRHSTSWRQVCYAGSVKENKRSPALD